MPFLHTEKVHIPTKDILSWCYDKPLYDLNKPIYVDAANPSRSLSGTQCKTLIRKLIAGFRSAGLQKGDCVCIHSFNHIYYSIIILGVIGAGGIYTGTNPSHTAYELKHHFQKANVKFIISEPDILSSIKGAAHDLRIPQERILILDTTDKPMPAEYASWRKLLEHGEHDWIRFNDLDTSKTTPAMCMFSSGTTGLPKPVMLTHYNFVAEHMIVFEQNTQQNAQPYEVRRIIPIPMFHISTAPHTHTSPLRSGHTIYVMPRFEVNAYLANVEKYEITELLMVPPLVVSVIMSQHPDKKRALRSVKCALVGAAPLDKDVQQRFQDCLVESGTLTQVFGMTETTCFSSRFMYPENDFTGSVGRFLPMIDVKLVDDEGRDITDYDVRGELCIRGPNVITEYHESPEANERDFDSDGFFHTGDILYCDGKTKLWYIVDRKKELIKVRGFQVAPAELEGVLLSHPQIIDAAVVGVRQTRDGSELPRAYVVLRHGAGNSVSETEIAQYLAERLSKYKRLEGGVKIVDAIPKTQSGKILKRLLRERAEKEMGAKL